MICLDTSFLIRCVERGSEEAVLMQNWYREGEPMVTPMLAWFEFVCAPLTREQEVAVRAFLSDILVFGESETRESARLYNAVGRKRTLRVDAMIAGTALVAQARLATSNRKDFAPFLEYGLALV